MMKNRKKVTIIELIIVIFVFVLPSYLSQDLEIDPAVFSNLRFNITYIATMIPQIAVLLLIIYYRDGQNIEFRELAGRFGFAEFDASILYKTAIAFAGTLILAFSVSLLNLIPALGSSEYFQPVPWTVNDNRLLPLILITCLTVGYREELIFRSYLITRFSELGLQKVPVVIVSAILFAGGHMYQGLTAFFGTFCIGLFLGALYLRFRNIHIIAIGHGIYNFFSLILYPIIVTFII